jgi:N-methylhydantoinase B
VISYICDRERAVVWGINGGLPSMPHGLALRRSGAAEDDWLGSVFSDVPLKRGDVFARPTAGGGGFGDPLQRDPEMVREDVIDGYVSIGRARKDYGVVIEAVDEEMCDYRVDLDATARERAEIRSNRRAWATADPVEISRKYKAGEIDVLDAVRRYAAILDWGTGELLPESTRQFREMFQQRSVADWT